MDDLALVLRELRRRHARTRGRAELTYRELAARTGWSHGIIGEYLAGRVLPPTDRFDTLIRLLGATPAEQGVLATARDRIEETRRAAPSQVLAPRQLPAEAFGFAGRDKQLGELDGLLDRWARDRVAAICAITGTAGVGKTTLAVRWAHRVADRFPDGQLYVDLRGFDQDLPVSAGDVLARLLRSLGMPAADIPADVDERAASYRTLLAGRRVLVLLDNASGVDHVRPLLPGTPTCLALITSRTNLAGLVAREGARRVDLDVLGVVEAVSLLRAVIGERADADPAASVELTRLCAGLPLALRIAAEIVAANPARGIGELVSDLRDEARRLDQLSGLDDPRTAVRTVFSWSYRCLSGAGARIFGLLGLHPGLEFDALDVAALDSIDLTRAQAALDELANAHLIEVAGGNRFAMHDLLRAYARECAPEAWQPLSRLFVHYVDSTAKAADTLFPYDRATRPQVIPSATPGPQLDDPGAALSWLDRQRANLVAVAVFAAAHGWPHHCVELSRLLWRHFEVGGHYQEALAVHASAERAARSDPRGAAGSGLPSVLANLGNVHWWLGEYREALTYFEQALVGHRGAGDRDGEARALARLGVVHERLGEYPAAQARLEEALALYRADDNRHGEGVQLVNLGTVHRRLGRYAQAATQHERAAHLFAELGDRRLEGYALGNLGADYGFLDRHTDALVNLRRALGFCQESADPGGQAAAMAGIGVVLIRMGEPVQAQGELRAALTISRGIGDRGLETEIHNALGEAASAVGDPVSALDHHEAALAMTQRSGDRFEQARALAGLAKARARISSAAR